MSDVYNSRVSHMVVCKNKNVFDFTLCSNQHIDCRNYPLREEKQGLSGFSEVPVMYVKKNILCEYFLLWHQTLNPPVLVL